MRGALADAEATGQLRDPDLAAAAGELLEQARSVADAGEGGVLAAAAARRPSRRSGIVVTPHLREGRPAARGARQRGPRRAGPSTRAPPAVGAMARASSSWAAVRPATKAPRISATRYSRPAASSAMLSKSRLRCSVRVGQSGAGVQCVVSGEPATRGNRQVVGDRAHAEHVAHLLGLRRAGLVDETERGHDDGVEEAQSPCQRTRGCRRARPPGPAVRAAPRSWR